MVAESLVLRHQLLLTQRSRRRGPPLTPLDRVLLGFATLLVSLRRVDRIAVITKTSTLLRFHRALVKRKYRLLYAPRKRSRPGPKGPSRELIEVVLEMKRRNPYCDCRKLAEQLSSAFGLALDKDVVRRILLRHYSPRPRSGGRSSAGGDCTCRRPTVEHRSVPH